MAALSTVAALLSWARFAPTAHADPLFLPLRGGGSVMILLCALALWFVSRKRWVTIALTAPVVVTVASTIIAWVVGVAPLINISLFGEQRTPLEWFPPFTAVEATIPIALASLAILLLAIERFAANTGPFAWATGVLLITWPVPHVLVLAMVSNDIGAAVGNKLAELAVSIALVLLGIGLINARAARISLAAGRGARWRSLLLVVAIAATLGLWYAVRAAEIRQLRSDVAFAGDETTRAVRAGLADSSNAADLLSGHWRGMNWRVSDELFLNDASAYMRQRRAIVAIAMLDDRGRVLKLASRETLAYSTFAATATTLPGATVAGTTLSQPGNAGNRFALGNGADFAEYLGDDATRATLAQAVLTTKTRQRGTVISRSAGAIFTYTATPIFSAAGTPLGVFWLLYRRDVSMAQILAPIAPDFHIRLLIGEQVIFERSARDGIDLRESRFQQTATLPFSRQIEYTFEIAPGRKIIDRALGFTPLLVLVFAWASLLLLMFALYNERRVQSLFQERERILNQSSDMICTLRADGDIVTANDAAQRILGIPSRLLSGRSLLDFVPPQHRDEVRHGWLAHTPAQAIVSDFDAATVATAATPFTRDDGRRIYLQSLSRWSPSEQLFYCAIRDVTAEHDLQLQRHHAEDTFRIGVAQAGCAVYEYQPDAQRLDGGHVNWVGAIRALTGYEPEELSSDGFQGWMRLVHPEDATHVLQIFERCLETEQPHTVDYRLRRKDGSYVPVLDRGRHLADEQRGVARMIGALIDLTAVRQQEIALRRSEERYRIIAGQVGAVIIERETASGRIRVFGPVEQIFGYTKDQLESRPLNRNDAMIHPEDRAHFFAAVDEAERTLSSYYVEHRRRHRGGHYIYIASRGVFLPGADGRAEREVIAITDISERKSAEARLQESEERFRLAAEQAHQIVYEFVIGADLKIVELRFAGATEQALGYSLADLRELQMNDRFFLIHPDDVDTIRNAVGPSLETTAQYTIEHRIRHRDGHYVHVENRGAVKRDADGKVIGIVGMLLDITSRRAAEADRQQYTMQLHSLSEIAHNVSSLLSLHELLKYLATSMRNLLDANAAAAMVVDPLLAPEETVATSYAEHYGAQRGPAALLSTPELHAQVLATNTPRRITAATMNAEPHLSGLTQHDDLRHPLRGWMGAPLISRDGNNLGLLEISDKAEGDFTESDLQVLNQLAGLASVSIENIRLYATLEDRVAARTRELEISNRELEAFSYSVSHDLRAPLRAIAGFSSILETEYKTALDAAARRYLQRITAGVERMANLIDDLLSLARVSRADLKRESVDISALSKAIVTRHRERFADRVIEISVDPRMKTIADPRLVEVALENLIENAVKFTGTRERAAIRVGHKRIDGRGVFFVNDNGVGFDPKYATNLFGVFQRLHSASDFPGTGVGLATVQRIVQRHHGRIWAESEIDRGATFYFTFADDAK